MECVTAWKWPRRGTCSQATTPSAPLRPTSGPESHSGPTCGSCPAARPWCHSHVLSAGRRRLPRRPLPSKERSNDGRTRTVWSMKAPKERRRWVRWLIAAVVVVVVLAVGGPFVYIHFIEGPAPAPLKLSNQPGTTTAGSSGPVAGTWKVGKGSRAGYRVQEVLVGQPNTAVGRTSAVTGTMTITG